MVIPKGITGGDNVWPYFVDFCVNVAFYVLRTPSQIHRVPVEVIFDQIVYGD